ncbi:hypothetical protein ABC795_03955 [Blastococcus sp. HT6-30]|uniref:hypothetical protein n=1 Tax=Blastococcus sp. HT6-30 TaxID=3144843 RepID=UPI00321A0402
MNGSFASLGFDPAPGDVGSAAQVAAGVTGAARALEEISAVLTGAAGGEWRGSTAVAFRELLSGELRPRVEAAARSFDEASRALHDWLDTMHAGQRRARALEAEHAEAVRRAHAAHASYAAVPAAAAPGGTPTAEQASAEADRLRARAVAGRSAGAADAEVDRITREARALLAGYEQSGREVAGRLQRAMDVVPDEPGFWAGLAEDVGAVLAVVGEVADGLRDVLVEVLDRLAPLLDVVGDLAGLLSTACGLLAFVPGLQVLAGPAVALGVLAAGAHHLAAVGETGSFTEALTDPAVLMDAVGVALGVGGLAIGTRLLTAARVSRAASAAGGRATGTVPEPVALRMDAVPTYFQLARSTSYQMSEGELVWRIARSHVSAGVVATTAMGARGTLDTAGRLARWEFGPLTRQPRAVA